jgi:hypothetical protein
MKHKNTASKSNTASSAPKLLAGQTFQLRLKNAIWEAVDLMDAKTYNAFKRRLRVLDATPFTELRTRY